MKSKTKKTIDKTTPKRKVHWIYKVNDILSVIVFLLALYILVSPFLPNVTLAISQATDDTKGYRYDSLLARKEAASKNIKISDLKPVPADNTLVIPSIGVDSSVFEGSTADTLNKGVWRRPNTSTPDKGSNTVLTAHRFLFTAGPNTFYSLDKLKVGDKFIIFWKGIEYNYEVFNIQEVKPTAIEVEAPTKDPIVTLYTCTPLWTSTERLVVKAKLIK